MLVCHFCGAKVTRDEPIPRDGECESCGHDLRCCRNCRHWDVHYSNECTETQADPVTDKAKRNFCEFFYFSREGFVGAAGGASREADARAKLDRLFGGTGNTSPPAAPAGGESDRAAQARAKLEGLFRRPPSEGEGKES